MGNAMFPIVEVPADASRSLEQLGTKRKFWYVRDGRLHLFKQGREGTGEDWAEKACAEIGAALGLPHAAYDLATHLGARGVVSPTFVPDGGELILGNQLLQRVFADYENGARYRKRIHTLGRVQVVLSRIGIGPPLNWQMPVEVADAAGTFMGYLMLDALVGNQDRHDENWAVIRNRGHLFLAPTFDHASSLGRNETDAVRKERLNTADRGRGIEQFVARARSALYLRSQQQPLSTLEAFRFYAAMSGVQRQYWLGKLESVPLTQYEQIFEQIPNDWASDVAKEFALKMLQLNRERLLTSEYFE